LENFRSEIIFKNHLHQISSTKKPGEKFRITMMKMVCRALSALRREFPNRHHPDFLKVMVLNNIFGGYFGSRLMSNIREDKGYTYGIHSFLQDHIHQSDGWLVRKQEKMFAKLQ
jgi:predicted Zn-dependent peptidase